MRAELSSTLLVRSLLIVVLKMSFRRCDCSPDDERVLPIFTKMTTVLLFITLCFVAIFCAIDRSKSKPDASDESIKGRLPIVGMAGGG
jgi:hypothetical protein